MPLQSQFQTQRELVIYIFVSPRYGWDDKRVGRRGTQRYCPCPAQRSADLGVLGLPAPTRCVRPTPVPPAGSRLAPFLRAPPLAACMNLPDIQDVLVPAVPRGNCGRSLLPRGEADGASDDRLTLKSGAEHLFFLAGAWGRALTRGLSSPRNSGPAPSPPGRSVPPHPALLTPRPGRRQLRSFPGASVWTQDSADLTSAGPDPRVEQPLTAQLPRSAAVLPSTVRRARSPPVTPGFQNLLSVRPAPVPGLGRSRGCSPEDKVLPQEGQRELKSQRSVVQTPRTHQVRRREGEAGRLPPGRRPEGDGGRVGKTPEGR